MSQESADAKIRQQRLQATFDKIYQGETSKLECPYCSSTPLRFSYTFVKPDTYGIWISCLVCGKEAHLRLKERPPGYSTKFVLQEFQERDQRAVEQVEAWWKKVSKDKK